ncbi:MAG: hypothetical protein ACQESR_15440 [Planctomycetota bacterium]
MTHNGLSFSRRRFLSSVTAACAVPTVIARHDTAAQWGTLRGRIVYDGTPPVPERITVTKDKDVCGQCPLYDETLLVDSESHGIKNVVVRLYAGRGETIEIHDSYQENADEKVVLKSKYCRFDPHVRVMRTTQKLVIRNADPKGDAVKIDPFRNRSINVTLPPKTSHVQEFPMAERMPAKVTCTIHPWELAWLVILEHPYVAVTDKNGQFEIQNVPVGTRHFMFWQEEAGYLSEVTFQGQSESWRRGTKEVDVKPGDNDLGNIIVKADLFDT